jgi:rod shape-determining protein MreC
LVSEVGANYAVVKSVLDSSLEISATIASSGHSGMVQGGYASGHPNLLRMNNLASNATIRNYDQVVTTGSTVYPRNLILGHVVDAGFDSTGVTKYAYIKPAADVRSLEQVFIVTEYDDG